MDAPLTASRGGIALALVSALAVVIAIAGCGSGSGNPAAGLAGGGLVARAAPADCPEAVLEAFGDIARRVYREGVSSERTVIAQHMIARSYALRQAVERGDTAAARSAAESLIATGHLTNLIVSRAGNAGATAGSSPAAAPHVLVDAGAPGAVAPVHGTLTGASGAPIGSFITSVWSDTGILAETNGIAEGSTALRERGRSVGGSFVLPSRALPAQGTFMSRGTTYQYTSFPAEAYPSGSLRLFVLKRLSSTTSLCGPTNQDTVVNTLRRVARRIYTAEAGRRTLPQMQRVEHNAALLSAVARRSPAATAAAIKRLLNQHIVRLRVSAGRRLLADVGGPFVLAPVHGTLRLGGRTIGSFVLSIQDDEGYLRLAKRLAGLDVLMYMGQRLVKNSLGSSPGHVPAAGYYNYRGRTFRVFSFNATAFPSGPLRIVDLAPIAEA